MVRRLVVDLTVPRNPGVVFEGDYITKVELEAVIRAIRRGHKKVIVEYRRQRIIADYEANKKKEEVEKDGTDRESKTKSDGSGKSTSTIDAGSVSKITSTAAGDSSTAKSGQGPRGDKPGSVSGSSPAGTGE